MFTVCGVNVIFSMPLLFRKISLLHFKVYDVVPHSALVYSSSWAMTAALHTCTVEKVNCFEKVIPLVPVIWSVPWNALHPPNPVVTEFWNKIDRLVPAIGVVGTPPLLREETAHMVPCRGAQRPFVPLVVGLIGKLPLLVLPLVAAFVLATTVPAVVTGMLVAPVATGMLVAPVATGLLVAPVATGMLVAPVVTGNVVAPTPVVLLGDIGKVAGMPGELNCKTTFPALLSSCRVRQALMNDVTLVNA